jgi:hypothetical protein
MKLSHLLVRWFQKFLVLLVILALIGWGSPASVSAATEYNETIQFSDDFDSCSGERVLINGSQHIMGRFTKDAAGRLHFSFTRHTQGKGIGQISGDDYILTDSVTRTSLESVSGEVPVLTEQYNSRLLRLGEKGSSDDTIVHFLSKVTIDANGEMTTVIEIQNVECR